MGLKRKITVGGLLNLIGDIGDDVLFLSRERAARLAKYGPRYIKHLEDYFPSVVKQVANGLQRRGLVEKIETVDGTVVKITDKGKKEILKYRLRDFKPKSGKWDGLWRLVLFDIPETDKRRRDELRGFLKMLGMRQLQDSVFIGPYDVSGEIRYLREILGIPHGVKIGVLKEIENSEELKEIFDLK